MVSERLGGVVGATYSVVGKRSSKDEVAFFLQVVLVTEMECPESRARPSASRGSWDSCRVSLVIAVI